MNRLDKVIVTISIGGYNPMYYFAHKAMQQYAQRVGADCLILTEKQFNIDWPVAKKYMKYAVARRALVEKLYSFTLLKSYQRVLFLDSDILVSPSAPDIFKQYADLEKIYLFPESLYADWSDEIEACQKVLNYSGPWPEERGRKKYYNSGVMLFSRQAIAQHQCDLSDFKKCFNEIQFYEQTGINYFIFKNQIAHADLDEKFNWTTAADKTLSRFDAYFIHHTGHGFGKRPKNRVQTFVQDYLKLYQAKLSLKERLAMACFKIKYEWRGLKYRLTRIFLKFL